MKHRHLMSVGLATALFFGGAAAKAAGVPFTEGFDNFDQWVEPGRNADLVSVGGFAEGSFAGFTCDKGVGCADLIGLGNAGRLESTPFSLSPGTYELSFALSGNQRGGLPGGDAPNNVTVSLGDFSEVFSKGPTELFGDLITRQITVTAPTPTSLLFTATGAGNIGMVLDTVSLTQTAAPVPIPAAAVLFLSALGCLPAFRRRRGVVENA